jgi:hypothetical protein
MFRTLGNHAKRALARALVREANEIMATSKSQFVPVDTGVLRASGAVNPPEYGSKGKVSITLGYGGSAVKYAIPQHENRRYRHTVGQWKYLETPALAATRAIRDGVNGELRREFVKVSKMRRGS